MIDRDIYEIIYDERAPLDPLAKVMPALLHLNRTCDFKPTYVDPKFKSLLDLSAEEFDLLRNNALDFVHPDDLSHAINASTFYLENLEDYKTISFTQRVLNFRTKEYLPLYTTSMFVDSRQCLMSMSIPLLVDFKDKTMDTLLEELNFANKHLHQFAMLSPRELELMKLWVQNVDNKAIARRMKITDNTVKSYKKKIYKKLSIKQFSELYQFAKAFDIV